MSCLSSRGVFAWKVADKEETITLIEGRVRLFPVPKNTILYYFEEFIRKKKRCFFNIHLLVSCRNDGEILYIQQVPDSSTLSTSYFDALCSLMTVKNLRPRYRYRFPFCYFIRTNQGMWYYNRDLLLPAK